MLRISEFARAGNITIRALRFYDEVGLLCPAHIVSENGYRQYSPTQFAQLNEIQALKDMGFSLKEIHELLQQRFDRHDLGALLKERCDALRKRLRDDAGRLERIEARLKSISASAPPSHGSVMLRGTPGQTVISLREKLQSYDEVDELFATLERRVNPRTLHDQRQAIFHRCLEGDDEIDCEAVRFLKQPVVAVRGLRIYESRPARVAFTYHYGAEDSISRSYESITQWVAAHGYQLSAAKREIYWPSPENKSAKNPLTEIQFPVTRSRVASRGALRKPPS